jgi:precorrin-4 methylase/DMSO/TMAO reductase YedYZ molybdopterin-dependent catalytic subunit
MMKRMMSVCLFAVFLFLTIQAWGASSQAISITGAVRQPLNLTMDDLSQFESVSVRLNEVTSDMTYHGSFNYRGVPLKKLLELADVQKEETDFFKHIDMAIVVQNKNGKQTVLSWGEVFYHNPAEIIIADSASPVIPMKSCKGCHNSEVYERWYSPLQREVGFPKLVVANDFYADRSLEGITNIEVLDLHPAPVVKKLSKLFSPGFVISGAVKKDLNFKDISAYHQIEVPAKQTGDGRGYHGLRIFAGVPLRELIEQAGVKPDMNAVFLVSAADGYRSLISYGELFLNPSGRDFIIADKASGEPLREDGKFILVAPDDLAADRWVKAVERIEVIQLKRKSKLYVIGIGCADTDLITLEAISYMGKSDVFVCTNDLKKRFSKYMGNKPVLFDPLRNAEPVFRKNHPELSGQEVKKALEEQRSKDVQSIKDALSSGNNVAFLEYGDPTIYGSWIYWLQDLKDYIEVIPGISAFNAANASIKNHIGCNGSIVLTVPRGLKDNEAMVKAVAEHGDTLAIFIGLKEMGTLVPLFRKYYPGTTPVDVVYRAGYSDSERLISTTLDEVLGITEKENEKHLGMIYVGPCLK